MIKDYQPHLEKVKNSVSSIGFSLVKDDAYEATFLNSDGWVIGLEGERYARPAFDLSVSINNSKFSVWLLMEVFNVTDKPSLTEQLRFISEKYKEIFVFPPPYLKQYDKANEVDI